MSQPRGATRESCMAYGDERNGKWLAGHDSLANQGCHSSQLLIHPKSNCSEVNKIKRHLHRHVAISLEEDLESCRFKIADEVKVAADPGNSQGRFKLICDAGDRRTSADKILCG